METTMDRGSRAERSGKPKRPKSSYNYFVKYVFAAMNTNNSSQKKPSLRVAAPQIAAQWKVLPAEKKRPYEQMYLQDRGRYLGESKQLGHRIRSSRTKIRKNQNMPKRPLNPFVYFCAAQRAGVKDNHPEWDFGQILKEMGRLWAQMDADTKKKYKAMAEEDSKRYKDEKATSIPVETNSCT